MLSFLFLIYQYITYELPENLVATISIQQVKTAAVSDSVELKYSLGRHCKKRGLEFANYIKIPSSTNSSKEIDKDELPELRELSRQEYLKKREEQERKLLRSQIEDEQELFDNDELTEIEKKKLDLDKKVLKLAESKIRASERAKSDFYNLPDVFKEPGKEKAKHLSVHAQRYDDTEKFISEQDEWEERQKGMSKDQIKSDEFKADDKYELLLEDEIEFVSNEILNSSEPELDNTRSKRYAIKEKVAESQRVTIAEQRTKLPFYPLKEEFRKIVEKNQVVIVVGETGSGKTTQIPQYLREFNICKREDTELKIGITQPRRVAAMAVATRVSVEQGAKLGHLVGYSIRFEDNTSPFTKIKYLTDGMLFREFLSEPDLASYGAIMIDEAHERTVFSDVLLGLLKDLIKFRPDLKVIISSATMDSEKFSHYFNKAPVFKVPGRMYPVEIRYTKAPEPDYLEASVVTVLQIHVTQPLGDILVFFTGQEEIEAAKELLLKRTRGLGSRIRELVICPIYSSLPSSEQEKVFQPAPYNGRKVVLATNIAETSLTIDGVKYVIDTGFCKQTSYNPRTGMDSLIVTPISKAQAEQRTGRAGRTSAGKCFRLYTKWSYTHELDDSTTPEIQRTNLCGTVLLLKSLGIDDLIRFEFLDPPPGEMLLRALEMLYALGALNETGELTRLGRRMAEFPTDPKLAKAILAAESYGCVEDVLTICAMLDVNASIFYRPLDKKIHAENSMKNFGRGIGALGDHMRLFNVYYVWQQSNYSTNWCYENYVQEKSMKRARDIRDQLSKLCDRVEINREKPESDSEFAYSLDSQKVRKAILSGYFYHTAQLKDDGSYRTVKTGYSVNIHPSASLFKEEMLPRWLVYHTLQFTKKEYMRDCSIIDPNWLLEIAPHYYKRKDFEDSSVKKMPKGKGAPSKGEKKRVTRDGIYY